METEYKTEWDLSFFGYKDILDPKIKIDYHIYETKINKFIDKWSKVTSKDIEKSPLLFISDINELSKPDLFWYYLSLSSALNQSDSKINKLQQELSIMSNKLSEKMIFITELLKEIGAKTILEWSNRQEFKDFKNYLVNTSESIKYILSDKEEVLLMKVSEATTDDIYDQYQAGLMFQFNDKEITLEELWALRSSIKQEDRIKAFDILSNEYNQSKNRALFGDIYSKVCKNNAFNIKLRNMPTDVMFSRNDSEEMDSVVVNKLLSKVKECYPLYQDFLKKKAKLFGVDKLKWYDVLASLESKTEKTYEYKDGVKLYLDTVKNIDKELYEHGLTMLDGKIDVYPKVGKSGGAFCSYNKEVGEWILLNWTGKDYDITTFAHELGHAFHGFMSNEQNYTNYHSSLCMAETASIFNETCLFNELLKDEALDKNELICNRLDDLFSTIFRQIMYIDFEKKCHQSWLDEIPLSWEDYNELWFNGLEELYGDSIELNKEQQQYGWMNISHIYHTPFYCYAYSFGNILSLNVYQGYIDASNKEEYMTKYKSFLKLGGSKRPKDAINDVFKLNIEDDKFYDMSFEYIKTLISQLN
jgi:oligoendopeptidase F